MISRPSGLIAPSVAFPLLCGMLTMIVAMITGCEEGVDPFIESDRFFSVFGNLDMNADTQFVRVVPVGRTIFVAEGETIDAAVSTTDLTMGQRVNWSDSVFTFFDGSRGHVFWAPLRIHPGHTYRLEVGRSDGSTSIAETTVPQVPVAQVGETRRLVLSNGGVEVTVPIVWTGIDREPARVEMWYRFLGSPRAPFTDIRFEYPTANAAGPGDPGWVILARLSDDRIEILQQIRPEDMLFMGMGMRVVVLDEKFIPPGGAFDPDILSQPGTFTNVENGFGFVGSIGRFDVEWVADERTAADLRYVLPKTHYRPSP